MKAGYQLSQIDEMDIHFWFELVRDEEEIEEVTADDIDWL